MKCFLMTSALTALWMNETESFQLFPSTAPFFRDNLTSETAALSAIHSSGSDTTAATASSPRGLDAGVERLKEPADEKSKASCPTLVQSRRRVLKAVLGSGATALSFSIWSTQADEASAATTFAIDKSLLDIIASKFRRVPAFALVDGPTGKPFMILKNTGSATGYFFTTYDGAQAVLDGAKRDAEDQDLPSKEMWMNAKISAVSLEFALKLAKGKPKVMAQNGLKCDTVYDIISSVSDLNDAALIDKSGIYTEQGRVPLFYMKSFETGPGEEGGEPRIPVFFNKNDLIAQYKKKFPNESIPQVQVFDLVDSFDAMLNPEFAKGGRKGNGGSSGIPTVMNSLPIASPETRKKAVEIEKSRGDASPYKLGEIIAVGGR